jgi:hypothetical protein
VEVEVAVMVVMVVVVVVSSSSSSSQDGGGGDTGGVSLLLSFLLPMAGRGELKDSKCDVWWGLIIVVEDGEEQCTLGL